MTRAILLYKNNEGIVEKHWIDFKQTKRCLGSGTFRPYDISRVEGNIFSHEHYMGSIYQFELPKFEGKEILQSFGEMRTSHTNNNQRFSFGKPKNTWFFRIEFHNVELCDKFQIVALYDGGLNPRDLDSRIIRDDIYFQKVKSRNIC